MVTSIASEQVESMGHVYTDIKLTNMFSNRSVCVRTLVDTGSTHMCVPASIARELGFDLEEVSVCYIMTADSRRVRCPSVAPVQISLLDRVCTSDVAVLGAECLMGVIPLEALDLAVDPVRQRVVPNPKHPDGPVFRTGKAIFG